MHDPWIIFSRCTASRSALRGMERCLAHQKLFVHAAPHVRSIRDPLHAHDRRTLPVISRCSERGC